MLSKGWDFGAFFGLASSVGVACGAGDASGGAGACGAFRLQAVAVSNSSTMKYWEIIAHSLSRDGWSWGYTSIVTSEGTLFNVDAHRGDGKRYIVASDELLTAFEELERQTRAAEGNKKPGNGFGS